jgi:DNA-binding HxlR family transcriptional regulator
VRRREGDGCPVSGALQLIGDKWTMLVVRDLSAGPRRTTELLAGLHPISSRTLVGRLRDMEHDNLIMRQEYPGSPPHVEYVLTQRGRLLLPLLGALRAVGETLDCNSCDDRKQHLGTFCSACPETGNGRRYEYEHSRNQSRNRNEDDPIVLL